MWPQDSFFKKDLMQFLQLIRWHTPVGTVLLCMPGLWAFAFLPDSFCPRALCVFMAGCFWARSLGCVYNDWVDAPFDKYIARSQNRPFAKKRTLSLGMAIILLIFVLIPLIFFLKILPKASLAIGVFGAIGTLIYPFLKRCFFAPQLFLALIFNLSAFMAPSLVLHTIPLGVWPIYAIGFCWTIEYDSIYAYQDFLCDKKMALHSLAQTWGKNGKWILFSLTFLRYGALCLLSPLFLPIGAFFLWKRKTLNLFSPQACRKAFLNAPLEGILIFIILIKMHSFL